MFLQISPQNGNGSPEISLDRVAAECEDTQEENRHLQMLLLSRKKAGVASPGRGPVQVPRGTLCMSEGRRALDGRPSFLSSTYGHELTRSRVRVTKMSFHRRAAGRADLGLAQENGLTNGVQKDVNWINPTVASRVMWRTVGQWTQQ